jgi:hypothetical protein
MKTDLRHDHEVLLESLLNGKLPRNLSWSDTVDLIGRIGEVQQHGGEDFAFLVGTQRAFFRHPSTNELGVEEVSRLRRFLREAETNGPAIETDQRGRTIVVIDHHGAHIYQDLGRNHPEGEVAVKPYDPYGFHHHLIHRKEAHYRGERVPEETSFYEEVAKDIVHAREIILVGHGTGKSSAVEFLAEYLKSHHPTVSKRVIATETADVSALTEPEVEALVKRHMNSAESNEDRGENQ